MEAKDTLLEYENPFLDTIVYYFNCSKCNNRNVFENKPDVLKCECGCIVNTPKVNVESNGLVWAATESHWCTIKNMSELFTSFTIANPCKEISLTSSTLAASPDWKITFNGVSVPIKEEEK